MNFDPEKILQKLHLRPRPPTAEELKYGTFNRRMIAASLDSFLLMLVASPIIEYLIRQHYGMPTASEHDIAVAVAQQAATVGEVIRGFIEQARASGHLDRLILHSKWMFYVYAIYSVVCWHFWDATPGKMICRLKVVDAKTGGKLGDWQSIMRVFSYLIASIPLGLGFFWIGLNKKRRGWHDYLAGSEVIVVRK
jgi:hypothetical protein